MDARTDKLIFTEADEHQALQESNIQKLVKAIEDNPESALGNYIQKEYDGDVVKAAQHLKAVQRHLSKKEKKRKRIKPNSFCPCGSKRRYKNCCKGVKTNDR